MKTSRIVLHTLVIASLGFVGSAGASESNKEGYLKDTGGQVVKSGSGLCWHTGSWTPAMAIAECDPDLVKKEAPKVAAADAPPAPPAPAAVREAPAFVPISLQAEALFSFDKAVLRAGGKKQLDAEVVDKMKEYPQVELVRVTGYTDRIGSTAYNRRLSQRRADAVKNYLVGQGIAAQRIETAAKGESDPIVSCDKIRGKATGKNRKLVDCLQPNRRITVEIEKQKPAQR
ncbi:outer membrane protein A precursor [mine drainage metagenome]|uniref:Outer membrane protein A n=1 Tax=mine drainage metagenome TaxID=410659 RepID=A0A1J5RKK1_9ZZZZ